MSRRPVKTILGMFLLWARFSGAQSPSSEEEMIKLGVADPSLRVQERMQIPEAAAAVEVRLIVEDPGQLDLDLFVYESDPAAGAYVRPLCISDGTGRDEICAVKRPGSGEVWAVVAAVDGEGKSPFSLTKTLVNSQRADLVLAKPVAPNGSEILVGADSVSFQFKLEVGEVAAVILEGEERNVSVEDEEGRIFPVRKTGIGRQQATIGEKFQGREGRREVDWLLRGLNESKRFLVKVGPSANPYGHADAILSVVRPEHPTDYAIVFSVESLDNEPKVIDGPSRSLTRPRTESPVLFRFLPRSTLMVAQVLPEESYDIAICDEFGFVISISSDRVLWNPNLEGVHQARVGGENVYFVVFPSPFAGSGEEAPKLTLLIRPLETK